MDLFYQNCILSGPISHQRLKCNRGPVVQDHYNLALGLPDRFQTIAQMAIEILNILCVKSMAGPKDFLLGY
jgi:hypothetical protein